MTCWPGWFLPGCPGSDEPTSPGCRVPGWMASATAQPGFPQCAPCQHGPARSAEQGTPLPGTLPARPPVAGGDSSPAPLAPRQPVWALTRQGGTARVPLLRWVVLRNRGAGGSGPGDLRRLGPGGFVWFPCGGLPSETSAAGRARRTWLRFRAAGYRHHVRVPDARGPTCASSDPPRVSVLPESVLVSDRIIADHRR